MTNLIKSWHNKTIRIRDDRYVSLTDMAQASGKRVNNWLRIDSTTSYLKALSGVTQKSATELVEVIQGGNPQNQGTWGHPKAAIAFARWCNDDFAVQVDFWIDELLTTGKVELAATKTTSDRNIYGERVRAMHEDFKNIPKDHWCILHESANLLIWIEYVIGYPVDRGDIVDISIGITWANERKGKAWARERIKGEYKFPKGIEVAPWTYHYDELPYFKKFLENKYKPTFLPKYLETKYGKLAKN